MNQLVDLTPLELQVGGFVGTARNDGSNGKHRSPLTGQQDAQENDIVGACGEMAFAKGIGVYWEPTIHTYRRTPDVCGVEVRTRTKPTYELQIRDTDADDRRFVLVRGKPPCPRFEIVGWYLAGEAKQHPEWLKTHGGGAPAYFVPNDQLRPMIDLYDWMGLKP